MNRFLSIAGNLLSLTVLIVLVFVAVTSLKSSASTLAPSGYPVPQSIALSSQPTAYPGPSENLPPPPESTRTFPLPLTPVLEEESGGMIEPSFPSIDTFDNGIKLTQQREIVVQNNEPEINALYELDLDGNVLVGIALLANGVAVIKIDLETGQSEFLTPVTYKGIETVTISGNHVAWVEVLSTEKAFRTQLIVYDLEQRQQTVLAQGLPRHPDMKDGLLTWQEYWDNRWIIYGYDLTLAKQFVIAESPEKHLFPRVCSRDQLIYMKNVQEGQPGTADLYTSNLKTGESILIGQVPFPSNAAPDRYHACDGDRIAWIGVNSTGDRATGFEQHVYDLKRHADRILDIAVNGLSFDVVISDDVLISTVGYDLRQDTAFDPFNNVPMGNTSGKLLLDDDRMLWVIQSNDKSWRLHTVSIVRNNAN